MYVHTKKTRENSKGRRTVLGLTVLELLIVLAAMGIVVLVSVPGGTYLLEKYRLKSTSNQLLTGLELARSEAQFRNSTVVVCPSSNGHSCRRDNNWNHGWVVFTDGNGNGTVEDIELIKSFAAPHEAVVIEASGAIHNRAQFTATGLYSDSENTTGQFKVCLNESSSEPRVVKVEQDGWVQIIPPHGEICNGDLES